METNQKPWKTMKNHETTVKIQKINLFCHPSLNLSDFFIFSFSRMLCLSVCLLCFILTSGLSAENTKQDVEKKTKCTHLNTVLRPENPSRPRRPKAGFCICDDDVELCSQRENRERGWHRMHCTASRDPAAATFCAHRALFPDFARLFSASAP